MFCLGDKPNHSGQFLIYGKNTFRRQLLLKTKRGRLTNLDGKEDWEW